MASQVHQIQPYNRNTPNFKYMILTPEPLEPNIVTAAWSYALRHTAQGLDLPDHEAALELMLKRHPSWRFVEGHVQNAPVSLGLAEQDVPENE